MDKAKDLADQIKELNSDENVHKDVDEKVDKVDKPLRDLLDALNGRQTELQAALLDKQSFKDSLEEFNRWLAGAENLMNLQGPVSARYNVILDQQERLGVRLRLCDERCY